MIVPLWPWKRIFLGAPSCKMAKEYNGRGIRERYLMPQDKWEAEIGKNFVKYATQTTCYAVAKL